jgi:hypothetical protein
MDYYLHSITTHEHGLMSRVKTSTSKCTQSAELQFQCDADDHPDRVEQTIRKNEYMSELFCPSWYFYLSGDQRGRKIEQKEFGILEKIIPERRDI